MNILVYDVAAEYGGAVTILKQFYSELSKHKENKYFFCVSIEGLKDTDNIRVLKFKWTKRSWFHRLIFEYIYSYHLIKKYKIDKVLSLQNTIFPTNEIAQDLYLHQPLPFIKIKFSIFENRLFWIYQNVISKFIYSSIKRAKNVYVQTEWMKNSVLEICKINSNKIVVVVPIISKVEGYLNFDIKNWKYSFFYPASGLSYKNHSCILKALDSLDEGILDKIHIYLTIDEKDISDKYLYDKYKENIILLGSITQEEVFEFYQNCILLFPSYIETLGLPLLEAQNFNTPIIASDCEFSRELLCNYDYKLYFDPFDATQLANAITSFFENVK